MDILRTHRSTLITESERYVVARPHKDDLHRATDDLLTFGRSEGITVEYLDGEFTIRS